MYTNLKETAGYVCSLRAYSLNIRSILLNAFVRQASVILDGTKPDGLHVHIAVAVYNLHDRPLLTLNSTALFCLARVVVYTSILINFAGSSNVTRDANV